MKYPLMICLALILLVPITSESARLNNCRKRLLKFYTRRCIKDRTLRPKTAHQLMALWAVKVFYRKFSTYVL